MTRHPLDAPLTRRRMLTASAAGLVGAAAGVFTSVGPAAAADYSAVPTLPGEVTRTETQFTKAGNAYEVIDVKIAGDRTRLFVPHASPPSLTQWVPVIWFYHAHGSSYASLSSAFKWAADPAVDYGAVSVCPNYGGAEAWASPAAITAQKNAVTYMNALWRIYYSFARANSGGGGLMCWAFGNRMLPRQHGMYLASGAYDMNDVYTRAPERVGPAYGYDAAAVAATNAASLPASAWAGARIRASFNPNDTVLPPLQHAGALLRRAASTATSVSYITHDGGGTETGHTVPSSVHNDMLKTFRGWAGL